MQSYIANLVTTQEIPNDGIISRNIYKDEQVTAVLFGFSQGQELSEHTAAVPIIIQIISGEARLTVGEEVIDAGPNAWLHLDAKQPHSVYAKTSLVMLLTLVR